MKILYLIILVLILQSCYYKALKPDYRKGKEGYRYLSISGDISLYYYKGKFRQGVIKTDNHSFYFDCDTLKKIK